MPTKVFLIHRTGFTHRFLRRYACESQCSHLGNHGYHNAEIFIDKGLIGESSTSVPEHLDKTDPRWPNQCACGYDFVDTDTWQLNVNPEYARADGALQAFTLRDAPVGAMWDADWYHDMKDMVGSDGKSLTVRTPGGDWLIDQRASNCTRPEDNEHKCWIRHGEPPIITVDKNGNTCAAGAGSIAIGNYHGFLQNGYLTDHLG